ncbi:kinase-like protein [Cylindrobasidium torrendii FP15055 ss-10]|uniref:Kinase-like protein n=1 Tax=Cylindrobasidium torrendii FP15055 ss-10 TaxID=1314674 RepID=A0A0D7BHK1_9AGAR|nr:kinase-like protein [Cylindrobasidium torrendii FP15055 ss-10]
MPAEYSPNLNPDRRRLHIRRLRQLVSLHGIVPKSLIRSVTMEFTRFSGGGFSDVHLGDLEGRRVVVKVLRIFSNTNNREQILWECRKEAVLWRQLHHENILHFLGIGDLPGGTIGLISPLMQNGDVMSFLRKHPEFDRIQCVIDIAEGLKFLHSQDPPIVHADIRGANILVKDDLHCCLADFGLSVFVESTFSQDQSGTASIKGAWRWLPPEALNTDTGKYLPSRDIYSLGCTIIEIFTGNAPFPSLKEHQVARQVIMGHSPPIPINVPAPEGLWNNLVPRCLSANPLERPAISNVTEYLHRLRLKSIKDSAPSGRSIEYAL